MSQSSPLHLLSAELQKGQAVLGAWCTLPEPMVASTLARCPGYAFVGLDMQHGAIDYAAASRSIALIAAAGKSAAVRIPVGDNAMASRALDAGASAIIAPMIESAEAAQVLAAHTRFPPVGLRSWGPQGALPLSGLQPAEYLATANRFVSTWVMIETRKALDALDEILAVEGIDGIFIGPSDLCIGLSRGMKVDPNDPEVLEAIRLVLGRTRDAGKIAAIFAQTGERAAEYAAMGFQLISVGSDGAMMRAGAEMMRAAALRTGVAAAGGGYL